MNRGEGSVLGHHKLLFDVRQDWKKYIFVNILNLCAN